jgi:trehalose 6-phosphate phosphatase
MRVASAPRLVVAIDFDGTLAPTVDDPATARALPLAVDAISELVKLSSTTVALVSGRHLAGLQSVVAMPPEVILVGSHGAETLVNGKESAPALSPEESALLETLSSSVEKAAAEFPGARVERKPSGCGLHTRLSSPVDAEAARAQALAAVNALAGSASIARRYGKDILEFTVRAADKGGALEWLRNLADASAVLFIGDDVTDEDGFRALAGDDVGIKVGPGDTAAGFRIADPVEVSELLAALVASRQHALSGASDGGD